MGESDTPSALLGLWLDMHALAGVDRKGFRNAQDAFNRVYRRATGAEQGEYHRLLAEDHITALSVERLPPLQGK